MSDTLYAHGVTSELHTDIDDFYRLLERPSWMAEAKCKGMTDVFYVDLAPGVDTAGLTAEARAICSTCPVAIECAEAGRDERHGIWAGLSVRERREARRRRPAA